MKRAWMTSLVLLCGLAFARPGHATDLKVTLEVDGRRFLVGVPITLHVTIENISGRTLYLAYGQKGFSIFPAVEPIDRGVQSFCPPQDVKRGEFREGYEIKPLGSGECLKYTGALCDFTRDFAQPGLYKVSWRAQSLGPYEKRVGDQVLDAYPQAWSGVADSNIVEIEILGPTGLDREALEKIIRPAVQDPRTPPGLSLWAEKVLKEYPTSTYAGYVVYEKYAGSIPGARYPNTATVGEDARKYALTLVASRPEDKVYKAHVKAIRENIAMIETVLRSHPDFAFHYGLEFYAGLQHLQLQELALAVQSFKKCTEADAPSLLADTAKIYLEVLKDRGWK